MDVDANADLVARAATGDQDAWDRLVARYSGLLWAVARGHRLSHADAADVLQTTWLRLVENLDRLRHREAVGGWLATTARRECLRVLRRAGRQAPAEIDDLERADPDLPAPDASLLASERDATLWRAFAGLPARCQVLLRVLMADPSPSYEEVGAALDMPIGSIGPTRGRCLRRLRGLLGTGGISVDAGGSL